MAFRSAPTHARRRRSSRLECVVARAVRRAHPHARHRRSHCRERDAVGRRRRCRIAVLPSAAFGASRGDLRAGSVGRGCGVRRGRGSAGRRRRRRRAPLSRGIERRGGHSRLAASGHGPSRQVSSPRGAVRRSARGDLPLPRSLAGSPAQSPLQRGQATAATLARAGESDRHGVERGGPCRMTLAVGGPTYVLCVLLFALLLYCGLGSLVFGRFAPWLRSRFGSFAIVVALVGVVTAEVIEGCYRLESVSSPVLRVACVLTIVAPIGLSLGAPFPDLLRRYGR